MPGISKIFCNWFKVQIIKIIAKLFFFIPAKFVNGILGIQLFLVYSSMSSYNFDYDYIFLEFSVVGN